MSKQIIVKPQGIITEPNKVGQFPPGALIYTSNAAIRSFGVVEQVAEMGPFFNGSFLNSIGAPIGGMYAVTDGSLVVFVGEFGTKGTWCIVFLKRDPITNGVFVFTTTIPFPYGSYITANERTGMTLMRNRLVISGTTRSFVYDIYPENSTSLGPKDCGVYQAAINDRQSQGSSTADEGGVLLPETHMAATVVQRIIHPDGYEVLSPPAVPYDYANLSPTLAQVGSRWDVRTPGTVRGGGFVGGLPYLYKTEVYRTRPQSVGYDSVNNKYIPISNGSSFYQAVSADFVGSISSGFYWESVQPNAMGEALLTNVSVGGASAIPAPPPPGAATCAVFRGSAFYANYWDPATTTILNPVFWGTIPTTASSSFRDSGVGVRTYSGTATNGSPTITAMPTTSFAIASGGGGGDIEVRRADTNALVLSGTLLSTTASTFVTDTNSSYTGAVNIQLFDIIEVNGSRFRAGLSAQSFAYTLTSSILGVDLDVTAVGLEPQTTRAAEGVYPSFVPTGGLVIRMRTTANIELRTTRPFSFSPKIPGLPSASPLVLRGKRQKNGYCWAENNEPENCPPSNFAFAGIGEIYRIIATRDCLWLFCSDGLFRLSGNGGSVGDGYDWVLDPADPGLIIAATNACCVHREYVYAYTNRGLVSISSEGVVRELSDGRVNPLVPGEVSLPNRSWSVTTDNGISEQGIWMVSDPSNDEVLLRTRNPGSVVTYIWAYNVKTDTLVTRRPSLFPSNTPSLMISSSGFAPPIGTAAAYLDLVNSARPDLGYENMELVFQPIYGAGSTAAHTQKHWQDIQVSFKTPLLAASTGTVGLDNGTISAGVRTIPSVSGLTVPPQENARVGLSVPRNWPAVSNAFPMSLTVTSTGAEPVTLEAISIDYIDFTDQRVRR